MKSPAIILILYAALTTKPLANIIAIQIKAGLNAVQVFILAANKMELTIALMMMEIGSGGHALPDVLAVNVWAAGIIIQIQQ